MLIVFPSIFVVGIKILYGYNFLAPLSAFKEYVCKYCFPLAKLYRELH